MCSYNAMQQEAELDSLIGDKKNGKIMVERPLYSQVLFDEGFESNERPTDSVKTWVKRQASKCECSGSCVKKTLYSIFPFLSIYSKYSIKNNLVGDVVAGLTVGVMHIPQGMAYGMLADLPPIHGLYVSFFPIFVYFFLGSSKHVSIGTFAVASLMSASAMNKLVDSDPESAILLAGGANTTAEPLISTISTSVVSAFTTDGSLNISANTTSSPEVEVDPLYPLKLKYAMALTFGIGCWQLLLGLLRLGFVTIYLSDPLISGFTTGAACHVFSSQIAHVFGFKVGRKVGPLKLIYFYEEFFGKIAETNAITLIISLACMVFMYVVKIYVNNNPKVKAKLKMPIPVELIVIIVVTPISYLAKLQEDHDVIVVGDIPTGLPTPDLKAFTYLDKVIVDSFVIAIVSYALSVSMAKILARKHDYDINANQELIAYGASNLFNSFFSSFVTAASLSRSLVQEGVGAKTQLCGLISSGLLILVLLFIGPLFELLPNCALAAIVIVNLRGMFRQFLELKDLWHFSFIDFSIWIVAWLATVLIDVDYGLYIGVGYSLLTVPLRSQRPYVASLGQMPDTDIYRDTDVYKACETIKGVKVIRFESNLYYCNAEWFRNRVYKISNVNPRSLRLLRKKAKKKAERERKKREATHARIKMDIEKNYESDTEDDPTMDPDFEIPDADVHTIVLDCSTMSYIDTVGVKTLAQVINEYDGVGIKVYLALCKAGIRETLQRSPVFYKTADRHCMFVTIHDAVQYAQKTHPGVNGIMKPPIDFNGSLKSNYSNSTNSISKEPISIIPEEKHDEFKNDPSIIYADSDTKL